jgi:protein TonB
MRTCTLLFSIVAHVCAACALLFTTVLASDQLPMPRDVSTFVNVVTAAPPVPPPALRPRAPLPTNPQLAPISAPEGIRDEPEPPIPFDVAEPPLDGVVGGFGSDSAIAIPSEPPPPKPAVIEPVRVGGVISPPHKIADAAPVYPQLARAAHVSGIVIIEAIIDEQGAVRETRVLRSIPLLDRAALDAVRQWRFTPTLLNGQVVPVVMTVTVNFKLD